MAKPVIKKNTSVKPKSAAPVEAPAPATKRTRGNVLIKVTASKLRDLIGADVEIGVSRKELTNLITRGKTAEALAEAGL